MQEGSLKLEEDEVQERVEISDGTNSGAYYREWAHVNSGLSLAVGFKPGILHSLKMVRLYRNMSELRV
jgi:hypothetical protein